MLIDSPNMSKVRFTDADRGMYESGDIIKLAS